VFYLPFKTHLMLHKGVKMAAGSESCSA